VNLYRSFVTLSTHATPWPSAPRDNPPSRFSLYRRPSGPAWRHPSSLGRRAGPLSPPAEALTTPPPWQASRPSLLAVDADAVPHPWHFPHVPPPPTATVLTVPVVLHTRSAISPQAVTAIASRGWARSPESRASAPTSMPGSSPLADVLWPAPFDGPATARLRQVRTPPLPSSSFWKDSANFSRHPHHPPTQVPRGEHHHFLQPIVSAPRCSPQCPQTVRHNVQEKHHVNDSVAEPHSCPSPRAEQPWQRTTIFLHANCLAKMPSRLAGCYRLPTVTPSPPLRARRHVQAWLVLSVPVWESGSEGVVRGRRGRLRLAHMRGVGGGRCEGSSES
jgi:hypothetical protein